MPDINSLAHCRCIIGGITIEGWSSDTDAFMPPAELEAVTEEIGADGTVTFHRNAAHGGEIVIKLLHDSPSVPKIYNKIARQEQFSDENWDGHFENLASGERIEFIHGVAKTWPLGSAHGAGAVGAKNFTFYYEQITPEAGRGRVRGQ